MLPAGRCLKWINDGYSIKSRCEAPTLVNKELKAVASRCEERNRWSVELRRRSARCPSTLDGRPFLDSLASRIHSEASTRSCAPNEQNERTRIRRPLVLPTGQRIEPKLVCGECLRKDKVRHRSTCLSMVPSQRARVRDRHGPGKGPGGSSSRGNCSPTYALPSCHHRDMYARGMELFLCRSGSKHLTRKRGES